MGHVVYGWDPKLIVKVVTKKVAVVFQHRAVAGRVGVLGTHANVRPSPHVVTGVIIEAAHKYATRHMTQTTGVRMGQAAGTMSE